MHRSDVITDILRVGEISQKELGAGVKPACHMTVKLPDRGDRRHFAYGFRSTEVAKRFLTEAAGENVAVTEEELALGPRLSVPASTVDLGTYVVSAFISWEALELYHR